MIIRKNDEIEFSQLLIGDQFSYNNKNYEKDGKFTAINLKENLKVKFDDCNVIVRLIENGKKYQWYSDETINVTFDDYNSGIISH